MGRMKATNADYIITSNFRFNVFDTGVLISDTGLLYIICIIMYFKTQTQNKNKSLYREWKVRQTCYIKAHLWRFYQNK
jgi:hypothetical protein